MIYVLIKRLGGAFRYIAWKCSPEKEVEYALGKTGLHDNLSEVRTDGKARQNGGPSNCPRDGAIT